MRLRGAWKQAANSFPVRFDKRIFISFKHSHTLMHTYISIKQLLFPLQIMGNIRGHDSAKVLHLCHPVPSVLRQMQTLMWLALLSSKRVKKHYRHTDCERNSCSSFRRGQLSGENQLSRSVSRWFSRFSPTAGHLIISAGLQACLELQSAGHYS